MSKVRSLTLDAWEPEQTKVHVNCSSENRILNTVHKETRVASFSSYHILTPSVINYKTDARTQRIHKLFC